MVILVSLVTQTDIGEISLKLFKFMSVMVVQTKCQLNNAELFLKLYAEHLKNGKVRFRLNIDLKKEKEDSWQNAIKTDVTKLWIADRGTRGNCGTCVTYIFCVFEISFSGLKIVTLKKYICFYRLGPRST